MTQAVPDILARIVSRKEIELREALVCRDDLETRAEQALTTRRDFAAALRSKDPAIIAEIKQASPSKGILSTDFQPARTAAQYERGGAAAISVLTDRDFFHGSLDHLQAARSATNLPVLRKDFTTSEYHVVEAAAHGADAILLIAAILTEQQMRSYRELAAQYGMASLIEVHDREELGPALASGAEIVGVNNRNLRTFHVTLDTSLDLADSIPSNVIKVSESGIESRGAIDTLRAAGYRAFLIGERLMRAGDPVFALEELASCS